jgi:hypothetical protein
MAKKNETNAAVKARKALAADANRERAEVNAAEVGLKEIPGRSALRVSVTHGKDGKAREVVSSKAVRNSKLLRTQRRADQRAAAGRAAARVAAATAAASATAE